jgi:hypothetical protein
MRTLALVIAIGACNTPLDQRLAIVRAPRVLAVTSEPAETKPGGMVAFSARVASPDGPVASIPSWALCTAPKPPTEDNAVAEPCLGASALIDLGAAETATATVPSNACIQFGPDVPAGGFRPRDPDSTGGYYQPVRADTGVTDLAFGFTRITCNLPTAPGDVQRQYQSEYVANQNPKLLPLLLSAPADRVPAGGDVTLTASWPASAVEMFRYFDPQSQTLVTRREAMRVSWFATGGAIDVDASAVSETDDATSVSTTWHAPATGPAWLWIVLRDSRGGIATAEVAITIQE